MRKLSLVVTGFVWIGASLSFGQAKAPEHVCEVNVTAPKPGGWQALEDARKKHNQFHVKEKDKTPVLVWNIVTGPNTGKYLTVSCGMTWKDMDGTEDFDKRDAADLSKTLGPASESNIASYYIYRDDLSTGAEGKPITKRMTIAHYFVKPGGLDSFTEGLKKTKAAVEKTKYEGKPYRWYQLVSGGEGPHFAVVVDRDSWSDMQAPEKTLNDALKEANGADDKTMQSVRDSIDHVVTEMAEYRPDLSYIPQK